ncbi:MAG: protoporphyrinogen oxidase HemJ [Flavobacteriales bacterium]|jgi:putative membrane protein|nr:protoporphyrinogen oxidase HemJ [Flavobacteriales bacterium]
MLYIKALHIIFVVTWFAGLFYIVRLFIYHVEANEKEEQERNILQKQYKIMSKRLWYMITWPSAILTVIFGTSLILLIPSYLKMPWMHLKLTFVLLLLIYHFYCHKIFRQLQKETYKWSSTQLRIWNEVATILLFAIVFLVVLKSTLNWIWGVLGIISFGVLLMVLIKLYKNYRENAKQN